MLLPSARFDQPFTCVDSTGVPTAPTGTPTAVLVKNGTDLGTTVTVAMSTAQGVASCTLPGDAVAGDRFYIRVSAVVSGSTYVQAGPVSVCGPHLITLPTIPTDWITSGGIAASAVTEIQSGLATSLAVSTLQTSVDDLPTNGEFTAALGDIPTSAEIFAAVCTSQITESYAADGTAPTLTQAMFLTMQHLCDASITSTTKTVKKLDGTTAAATFTLDSATAPTSIARAT